MAAANASPRGQRVAIFASTLSELSGFCLVVDCLTPGCGGERTFAMSDLAGIYGVGRTVGDVLRRMRCSGGCGGRAGAACAAYPPPREAARCRRKSPSRTWQRLPFGCRTLACWPRRVEIADRNGLPGGSLVIAEPDTSALRRGRSLVAPWLWLRRTRFATRGCRIVSQSVLERNAPRWERSNFVIG